MALSEEEIELWRAQAVMTGNYPVERLIEERRLLQEHVAYLERDLFDSKAKAAEEEARLHEKLRTAGKLIAELKKQARPVSVPSFRIVGSSQVGAVPGATTLTISETELDK